MLKFTPNYLITCGKISHRYFLKCTTLDSCECNVVACISQNCFHA